MHSGLDEVMHSTQVHRNWPVGEPLAIAQSKIVYTIAQSRNSVSVLAQKFDCSRSHHGTPPGTHWPKSSSICWP